MQQYHYYTEYPFKSFFYVGLFSLAIAFFVWALGGSPDFGSSLAVSLSIGWSICAAFVVLTPVALNWLGPYLAAIPITAIGLVVGLGIGGWMVSGRVTFFFVDDFTTRRVDQECVRFHEVQPARIDHVAVRSPTGAMK